MTNSTILTSVYHNAPIPTITNFGLTSTQNIHPFVLKAYNDRIYMRIINSAQYNSVENPHTTTSAVLAPNSYSMHMYIVSLKPII